MSSFTEPLIVKKISKRMWEVQRGFNYHIGAEHNKEFVHVPEGFPTDFASIPRILWIIFPPDGQYTQSSVLHDYLYFSRIYKRRKADHIFLESMKVLEVPFWKRHTMYRAVRLCGWIPWKKKLKK